jgi:hypothetical protein
MALSTNNKGFTSGGKEYSRAQPLSDLYGASSNVDDDDVRFGKLYNTNQMKDTMELYEKEKAGKKDLNIYEESPNGYVVSEDRPRSNDNELCLKHYTAKLRHFTVDYPEEWALCHYLIAKIFLNDRITNPAPTKIEQEARAKKIENALFHCDKALQIYTYSAHPGFNAQS